VSCVGDATCSSSARGSYALTGSSQDILPLLRCAISGVSSWNLGHTTNILSSRGTPRGTHLAGGSYTSLKPDFSAQARHAAHSCGAKKPPFVNKQQHTATATATATQPHSHTVTQPHTHTGQQPHISPGHGVPSSPVTEGNSKLICNAPARRCSRRGTAVSSPLSTRPRDALCTSSCCWCTCMHTHTCGQHAAAVRAGKGSATYVPDVGGKHGGADTECSVVSRPAAWLPAPAPAPAPAPVPTEPPACDRLPVLRFFLGILGATAGANDRRRSRQVIMTTPRRPTHTRVANQKGRHQAALVGLAVGRVALPLPCRASTTRSAALPAPAMPPPVDAAVDRPCRVAAPAPCL